MQELVADGMLEEDNIIVESKEAIDEFYHGVWYGNLEGKKLRLDLIEACLLMERGRLKITSDGKELKINDLIEMASDMDPRFIPRYAVYKDLRERGLPVRIGFKGSDFRVYERGAKPGKAETVKWIVFVDYEDYSCEMDKLGKTIEMAENIRAEALWGIADDDGDVTYYIIKSMKVL